MPQKTGLKRKKLLAPCSLQGGGVTLLWRPQNPKDWPQIPEKLAPLAAMVEGCYVAQKKWPQTGEEEKLAPYSRQGEEVQISKKKWPQTGKEEKIGTL